MQYEESFVAKETPMKIFEESLHFEALLKCAVEQRRTSSSD